MSGYVLYSREGSGSMVIEAALAMVGAPYQPRPVSKSDADRLAEVAALNPAAKIPVLLLPGGAPVSETMAILIALDERHPEAALLPPSGSADRPVALQWLAFLATSTYPAALRFFYADRYTLDQREPAVEAVKQAGARDLAADLELYMRALQGPFLFDHPSIVDVYALMLADWHGPSLADPRMAALKDKLLAIPAIRTAWVNHDYAL